MNVSKAKLQNQRLQIPSQPFPENLQRTGDLILHGLHAEAEKIGDFTVALPFKPAQPEDVPTLRGQIFVDNSRNSLLQQFEAESFFRVMSI